MAVYERTYRLWTGESTPTWSRFTILPRYAVREIFRSRVLLAYFICCFIYPLGCAALVYVANSDLLKAFPDFDLSQFLAIDASFFMGMLRKQIWVSLFLAIFVGPGLVSRDLANNGLPLILSRPFSRVEYVVGKMLVLCSLMGAVVWLAPLLVLSLHINFQGLSWIGSHKQLVIGLLVAPWLWIVPISLFSLAMSAWVRWKAVAGFGMLFIVLAGSLIGLMVGNLFHTAYGSMVNLILVVDRAVASMLGTDSYTQLPAAAAWTSLALFLGLCFFLLETKLRAYQVVR